MTRAWSHAARDLQLQRLQGVIAPQAMSALEQSLAAISADPRVIGSHFPAASRTVGRGPADPDEDPADPFTLMADDVARAAMILTLDPEQAAPKIVRLYRYGDSRERRGVLRALDAIPPAALDADTPLRDAARSLIDDALRTNDVRLVAAALGPTGARILDDDAFAQAMLKCVFVGVDILRVDCLAERTTPELSRMMADFVHERIAAGREVPAAVWTVIDSHPPAQQLEAILAEASSPVPRRAEAARAALAKR